jgi:hypothetical protein
MKSLCYALLCLAPLIATASNDISKVNSSIHVEAGQSVGDVESVNGSIHVDDAATTENVNTVNGSISIGNQANVGKINTVNGGIGVGEQSKAGSIETVNGTLKVGAGSQIANGVSAVNGSISLAKGVTVAGKLQNVNGKMTLEAAHVGAGIETTNGDIDIRAGSRVQGGIVVEKPHGNWFGSKRKPPTIVIGPDAIVEGELRFEQPVTLYVSNRAKTGAISGATAIPFSGDAPPSLEQAHESVER